MMTTMFGLRSAIAAPAAILRNWRLFITCHHSLIRMALEDYAKKRDFEKTPEPAGAPAGQPVETRGGVFCIQRHDATRLHYDLRLEVGGVLKSWAVPQGPSLDPKDKRLAVHVEDHPMEYGGFEGNIPKGNYGAGSVMLWDNGTYEVIGDPAAEGQLARGDFKFRLHGRKLKGDFVLVRTKTPTNKDWLLIKKKDDHAIDGWNIDAYAYSILTGRTQEEIAADLASAAGEIKGAKRGPMPSKLAPMLAQTAARAPRDPGWLFEVKWDGVRSLCYVNKGKASFVSRNGNNMDRQYPELAALPEALNCESAVLDGEIVALDETGRPSFSLLQRRMHVGDRSAAALLAQKQPVCLYLFDLLYLDGWDLRRCAVEDRKRLLKSILIPSDRFRLSGEFLDQGEELITLARQTGLEGIVAKRLGSTYESKRTPDWLKIKIFHQQEFVLCGYTTGEREYFSSLILGLYDKRRLVWTGNVGTGFDHATIAAIYHRLQPLLTSECPFGDPPPDMLRDAVWTRPELVCQVKYGNWTEDRRLRAPVYLGLRNDVSPADCVFESEPADAGAGDGPTYSIPPPLLAGNADKVILGIDGRRLTFTNLNKLYYPRDGYAKRDLLNYYHQIAGLILPHLRDRALSLRRYPDGIEGQSFFQKDASEHFPDWLRREPIHSEHNGEPIHFVVANDRASLLYLANLGCIDQNPWMSRIHSLEHPDFILIDLDPQECGYDKIVEAALLVRQKLDILELTGYPKTTGGDGMHIYIPVEPLYTFEQARSFAEVIARVLAVEKPDLFTTARAVSKREKGRVYFDWAQISTGKTISAPYVLRAYPGAPVATPLEWREVKTGLTPQQFHLRNVLDRFARTGDLFAGVLEKPQRLESAISNLDKLIR
jgi:bifunctional non-homologous end joining protein LigD